MLSNEEAKEIVDAIASLNEKYDALSWDFTLYKMTHELKHNHRGTVTELKNWSKWARDLIIALIAAILAIFGSKLNFGGF